MNKIELAWNRLLGFNHVTRNVTANATRVGDKNKKPGASADFCVSSLGAKIGSKQCVP